MKKTLVLSLAVMILLAACKKDKKEPSISLKGKWTIENLVQKEYENGVLTDTETLPGDGTTYDFQDNGNLAISSPGSGIESFPYNIKPDSKVEIDGDIIEVRNLTGSTVTLFFREDLAPNEYTELFLNLKR